MSIMIQVFYFQRLKKTPFWYNLCMATTYAHWAFGRDCIEVMPKNLQIIVDAYRDYYDIGVHGPDIFFYDMPHSDTRKYGYRMHNIPNTLFFERCKKELYSHPEKGKMIAYIVGYLTHFVLDSQVHGYIERKIEVSGVNHTKIESQWDRHMMIVDSRIPNLVDRSESLHPNKENAKIISYFYDFDAATVLRVCRWQVAIIRALNSITITKQHFIQKIVRKLNFKDYADLFIGFEEIDKCMDSNIRLDKLREKSIGLYKKLVVNLINYLDDEINEPLDDYFDRDLSPEPDYKKIPVYPFNKEIQYKV